MSSLAKGLDLRRPLRSAAEKGFAFVSKGLDDSFRKRLRSEIDAGPFAPFEEEFGPVKQQIDGYDIAKPMTTFPRTAELFLDLRDLVRRHGREVRGLATWAPNEAGIAHYVPGSIGITPHLDGKWYRRLVVVVTVYGRSRFAICGSRSTEDVIGERVVGPGDLVFMRGPGLGGARDGRPYHLVEGPKRGERLSLGIRMSGPGAPDS
ncbi:MAG: hypothetical protein WD276_01680 [Actinomycetota bacterium]